MTRDLQRLLAELEGRLGSDPQPAQLEQVARLAVEVGRADEARAAFGRAAERKLELKDPTYTAEEFHLQVANLWRLAGRPDRAGEHLSIAVDTLAAAAEDFNDLRPLYLYSLLLAGDDDEFLTAAGRFGQERIGERCWSVVEAVLASRSADVTARDRWIASIGD